MLEGNFWAIKNVRLTLIAPLIVATATVSFAPRAEAAGTVAGSTIANTATANYTDSGGNAQTATSNTANLRVDELLDVAVTSADPGDIPTLPSGVNQVASFTVTNTGNGSEAYGLAVTTALGGDQFDPTATSIVLDTNGNGVYDAGVDTVYAAGTNDPVLAPDASIRVFVLSTMPGTAVNGDRGQLSLAAASRTLTGAPGASANGQGQGGGDAVVGTSGGDGTANGAYVVQVASISFTKTSSVVDPFGGNKIVPGSIVTYTLTATVSGTGSLTNVTIADNVPANTTYIAGTMTLQGTSVTDTADADGGVFVPPAGAVPGRIEVALGAVAASQTRTVTFNVRIN